MRAKFLSTSDASKKLGVTPAAVRLMVNEGRIKATAETEGGIRLFTRREVERVLKKRRTAPKAPGDPHAEET
jgi:DNA-binding transcriptional MerR regulator